MTSLKKNETQNQNFCYIADVKTSWIWGFEQLPSAIVSKDTPTQKHVQTAWF